MIKNLKIIRNKMTHFLVSNINLYLWTTLSGLFTLYHTAHMVSIKWAFNVFFWLYTPWMIECTYLIDLGVSNRRPITLKFSVLMKNNHSYFLNKIEKLVFMLMLANTLHIPKEVYSMYLLKTWLMAFEKELRWF